MFLERLTAAIRAFLEFMQDGEYHAALVDARMRREQVGPYAPEKHTSH